MNIKIDNAKNKKKYLDEAMYIGQRIFKLMKYPHMTIKTYTSNLLLISIVLIIAIVVLALCCIGNKNMVTACACIIAIYALLLLTCLIRIINANKILNLRSKEKTDSEIKIDKNKIILKNNNNKMTVEQNWNDIKFVKLTKYGIIFVNNEENKLKSYIIMPIEYKDELLKAINKYDIKIDIIGE